MRELLADSNLFDLQALMDAGTLSGAELTSYFTERIHRLDSRLNAVIALDPNALDEAQVLDAERLRSGARSPLHGIPILIKDNIETRNPLPTTAGSLALRDNRVDRDAPVVAALRAAGAVILGKANLSEWANFRSHKATSGWSAVGGQTRNPYDTTRSPCGSSAGSAVAVAAGFAVAAVGTETDGSIICPASVNGVVGFKPAVGKLSQRGIVPISHSQDTAGPIARSVIDIAILTAVMAGGHRDSIAQSWLVNDAEALLKDRRVGVVRSYAGFGKGAEELLSDALESLRVAGAAIADDLHFETPEGFRGAVIDVLFFEFKHNLNAYLATLPGALGQMQLKDLIAFNTSHAAQEMPHFRQELFEFSESKAGLDDRSYLDALELVQRTTREEGIDALMQMHRLDVLISPSIAPAWPIDHASGDPRVASSSSHAAVAGYPHITVPMGYVDGLPVGLSLYARPRDFDNLLRVARGYELVAPARHWPDL